MSVLRCLNYVYALFFAIMTIGAVLGLETDVLNPMPAHTHEEEAEKEAIDKVIEDEITQKLSEDLLQSIEKKFQVDLERSVDSVLSKIKMLLQNGTTHIQDKLVELQSVLEVMRRDSAGSELVDECLLKKQNETASLAERALHQMVVCGYALIGHDPAQAMRTVMELKNMINTGLKPVYDQRHDVYGLIKICGHDHDSLKKVIKCVISKSPHIKSAMMGVSARLIDGVIQLTKLMAHGAMHEACLIEVIRTVEDEAFALVKRVRRCVDKKEDIEEPEPTLRSIDDEMQKYLQDNNATVLDADIRTRVLNDAVGSAIENAKAIDDEFKVTDGTTTHVETASDLAMKEEIKEEVREEMKKLLRRMMSQTGKDGMLKYQLLQELEKESNNNIDGKV